MTVCHLIARADWDAARAAGGYAPASLAVEGFIHLSTPAQVPRTAARFFAGVPDLLVLVLDAAALGDALRWEPVDDDVFPHLYRAIDPAEVLEVRELRSGSTGAA